MSFELDILSYTLLGSIFGAAALLSIRNARGPDIHPLLLNTQSDVSRVRYPGSSAVYRSRMYPNGSPLLSTSDRSIRTLRDWYLTAFGKFKGKTFICDRTPGAYAWHNYETIEKKAKAYFSGLVNVSGLEPLSGRESSFVGIFSPNTADTLAIEIGCHCGGLVTVPISQDTTPSHLSHVLENSGLKVLVIHSALLNRLTAMASNFNLHVPHIIVIGGGVAAGELSKLESLGVKIHQLPDIERNGTENPVAFGEPQNNNIASIYYTSSSPSNGKHGVILTHKNLLSVAASYALIIPPAQRLTPKDRLMHNLPIDDVYGHILTLLSCACGSSLVYAENVGEKIDTPTALSNAAEAKPTILASGSTFLEQVKDLIETRYGNSFLFRRGLDKKKAYFEEGRLVTDSKYDMLVFRDIRQKLFGGNLRLVLIDYNGKYDHKSGLASFLRAVLGTQVLQAFNRPETASSVSLSMFFDYRADPAAVGAPLPCNEIKLEDLPDRGYTAEDKPNPRGEICVRGNNVFAGYWNDDLATERVKDADGWYMTSIIGEILPNGTLKILGPK